MSIRIVNTKNYVPCDSTLNRVSFYVGRARRDAHKRANHVVSVLGNPYIVKHERERDIACDMYDQWLNKMFLHDNYVNSIIQTLVYNCQQGMDIDLVCFCHPKRCHAESIKKLVEEIVDSNRKFKE